ncbi:fumarylacetoacetate hydrolase family protein [Amycolatopsis jejuensis]|uniref:fumarylacetoacetate hydrolase family protein n=1 Tax=Amycolatopsis jejuensis TaxID=330084 RepID=UPI0006904F0B|nr:fumarylacetoacetate hydrolase family protein [Amycolatopsis jejuensis]
MRYATVRVAEGTRAARLHGAEWVLLEAPDVGALLRGASGEPTGDTVPAADADLAPVVPAPRKILCIGLNYARHVRETGREFPQYPTVFGKYADALIGPRDPIVLPPESDAVDWEAELAIVVGRTARRIDPADALDHIAGYTVLNDISMRDWQRRTTQWLQGKTFEASTPVGPLLVTPGELPEACRGLRISCEVDGVEVQRDVLGDFIFDIPAILAYLSAFVTLRPGDLIATGTPDGVGMGRSPQVYLRAGQRLTTTIEGIGALVNDVVAPPHSHPATDRPATP